MPNEYNLVTEHVNQCIDNQVFPFNNCRMKQQYNLRNIHGLECIESEPLEFLITQKEEQEKIKKEKM